MNGSLGKSNNPSSDPSIDPSTVEERKKEDRKGKNPECLVAIEMRKDQGKSLKGPRSISSIGSVFRQGDRTFQKKFQRDIPQGIQELQHDRDMYNCFGPTEGRS